MSLTPEQVSHLRAVRDGFHVGGSAWAMPTVYLSTLSLAPKVARGKFALGKITAHSAMLVGDGARRMVPLSADRRAFYGEVVAALGEDTVSPLPEAFRKPLGAAYQVGSETTEYLCQTQTLIDLPGGDLKRRRQHANRTSRVVTLRLDDPSLVEQALEVNRLWYRDAAKRMFRPNDKTNIDWALQNLDTLRAINPSVTFCCAVDDTGRVVAFQLAEIVCNGVLTYYTFKYLPDLPGVFDGLESVTDGAIAAKHVAAAPVTNLGPSTSAQSRERKLKLVQGAAPVTTINARLRGRK